MRKKIIIGIGEDAAKKAAKAGASKATCSRIRRGMQDFYYQFYHKREERKTALIPPEDTIKKAYSAAYATLYRIWPEVNRVDADDIVQEIILRVITARKKPSDFLAVTVWWARRIALNERKVFAAKRRKIEDFNEGQACGGYNLAYAQALLNAAQPGDELYKAFWKMRKAQEPKCMKCETKRNWTLHHVVPRRHGGENTIENTVPLCRHCHNRCEVWYALAEALGNQNWQEIFLLFIAHDDGKMQVSEIVGCLNQKKEVDHA